MDEEEKIEEKPKVTFEVEEVKAETPAPVIESVIPEAMPQVQPELEGAKNGNSYKWLVIVVVALVVAAVGVWGFIWWQKAKVGTKITVDLAVPTPVASIVPSPSPVVEIKLSDYKIKIENGSGIAGEAGRAKDLLETAGFIVSGTGNAKSYDFTKTIISTGSKVSTEFVSKLQDALGKKYIIGPVGSLVDELGVQVVVGSDKVGE